MAFQANCRGFKSRLPLQRYADVAQEVERVLGKDVVTGSNPVVGFYFEGVYLCLEKLLHLLVMFVSDAITEQLETNVKIKIDTN